MEASNVTVTPFEPGGGEVHILVIVLAVILMLGLVIWLARAVDKFFGELRYLNMEIGRTAGAEQRHYLRRRRRLWLSLIPFVKYE